MTKAATPNRRRRRHRRRHPWLPAEHLPTPATIGVAELEANVLIEVVVSAAKPD